MAGHTYRYSLEEPLYPFGYGLSYTTFAYSNLVIGPEDIRADQSVTVRATVTNTGGRAGDEVVQCYVSDVASQFPVPIRHLEASSAYSPGESREVAFTLTPRQLAAYDDDGRRIVEPGGFVVSIGGGQPTLVAEGEYVTDTFSVYGDAYRPE